MKTPNLKNIFNCEVCEFKCSKKSEWIRHNLTDKHISNIKGGLSNTVNIKNAESSIVSCQLCKKVYKSRTGLWRHNKKYQNTLCYNAREHINDDNVIINDSSLNSIVHKDLSILTNLVLEVIKSNNELQKQNQDLQKQVLDVCKNLKPVNISNSNNNNNNKIFNLQFFLNEECKDAMNLNDFVESVQLQMADLEKIGELGYVEGVSKFIMGKLNETDVNKRPVHCSDAKRETLYIKDDNVWTKEGAENSKIRGAVKKIEKKNIRLLNVWKETHTGCMDSDSPYNDQYTHMIIGSLGGCEPDNVNKVIKKIAKATIIDK
jgi:hypothetical protein